MLCAPSSPRPSATRRLRREALREAQTTKESAGVAHAAELEAVRVKLAAAEEEAERSAGKYRSELLHHSEDMQALAAAKEAQSEAIKAREAAETRLAEVSIDLETSKGSFEERSALLAGQISQLEERLANAARENALLHSQLQRLGEARPAGGAAGVSSPAGAVTPGGRRPRRRRAQSC